MKKPNQIKEGYIDASEVSEEDLQICRDLSEHALDRVQLVIRDILPMMPHPVGAYLLVRNLAVQVGKGFGAFASAGHQGSDLANIRTGMALALLEILARSGCKEAQHITHSYSSEKLGDGRELCRILSQMKL